MELPSRTTLTPRQMLSGGHQSTSAMESNRFQFHYVNMSDPPWESRCLGKVTESANKSRSVPHTAALLQAWVAADQRRPHLSETCSRGRARSIWCHMISVALGSYDFVCSLLFWPELLSLQLCLMNQILLTTRCLIQCRHEIVQDGHIWPEWAQLDWKHSLKEIRQWFTS